MRKITPRVISKVKSGEPIIVKFTSIQGQGGVRGGQSIEHEGKVDVVNGTESLSYDFEGQSYCFELSTGYIRDEEGGEVLGRDAYARIE
jgi:hypothetical protein